MTQDLSEEQSSYGWVSRALGTFGGGIIGLGFVASVIPSVGLSWLVLAAGVATTGIAAIAGSAATDYATKHSSTWSTLGAAFLGLGVAGPGGAIAVGAAMGAANAGIKLISGQTLDDIVSNGIRASVNGFRVMGSEINQAISDAQTQEPQTHSEPKRKSALEHNVTQQEMSEPARREMQVERRKPIEKQPEGHAAKVKAGRNSIERGR